MTVGASPDGLRLVPNASARYQRLLDRVHSAGARARSLSLARRTPSSSHRHAAQVSDHSRECTRHRDATFSLSQYETCAVSGGDGLAFVIHGDENGTAALGGAGSELGYGGLRRALVVEVRARGERGARDSHSERRGARRPQSISTTILRLLRVCTARARRRRLRRRGGGVGDLVDHVTVPRAAARRRAAAFGHVDRARPPHGRRPRPSRQSLVPAVRRRRVLGQLYRDRARRLPRRGRRLRRESAARHAHRVD